MSSNDVNEYLKTKVMTASPAELRLLLLDGSIRFAEQARMGLVHKDFEQSYLGSTQCRAILTELITSLRPEVDRVLCERLTELYTVIYNELVSAMSEKNPEGVAKVVELLVYERETWAMAMERLSEDKSPPGEQLSNAGTGEISGGRIHLTG